LTSIQLAVDRLQGLRPDLTRWIGLRPAPEPRFLRIDLAHNFIHYSRCERRHGLRCLVELGLEKSWLSPARNNLQIRRTRTGSHSPESQFIHRITTGKLLNFL